MGDKRTQRVYCKRFALDDELLKKGTRFGKDYFDHLLSRIREIRASERRFNQKITDLSKLYYRQMLHREVSKTSFLREYMNPKF